MEHVARRRMEEALQRLVDQKLLQLLYKPLQPLQEVHQIQFVGQKRQVLWLQRQLLLQQIVNG